MDAVATYSVGSFGWLTLQAVPLITWPSFISTILGAEGQRGHTMEEYYARSLGFALLTIGLLLLVLSGTLPLASAIDGSPDAAAPYASAALLLTLLYQSAAASYCYARFHVTGQTGYLLGCVGSSVFAAFGLWCLMFGGEKARISKRTGADKRTSGWPFGNQEAAKRKAKKTT